MYFIAFWDFMVLILFHLIFYLVFIVHCKEVWHPDSILKW